MRAAGHLVTGVARRSPLPFSPGSAEAGWDTAEPDLSVCAVFGELSLADGGLRSADAETLEACQLLLIPRETVQRICHRVPLVAHALTSSLAATLRRLTEAASDLAFLDLPAGLPRCCSASPEAATAPSGLG